MNNSFTKLQHNFFLFLLIASAVVMFFIYRPFLNYLVLAGSFAVVFYPIYNKLLKFFRNNASISSFVMVVIILFLVLAPLITLGGLMFNEAQSLYFSVANNNENNTQVLGGILKSAEKNLKIIAPDISLDAKNYIQGGLQWIVGHLDSFFSRFISILMGLLLMIIALFFLFRDGKKFRDRLYVLSPLAQEYDENIFAKIVMAVNSVIKGSLVVAFVQGIFATAGFAIAGVPNPIIWGVTAMLTSLIPGVGTSLVTVPCIFFLFLTRPLWQGIGLTVWAIFGIGLIDNILAPYVIEKGMKIHPFLILLSVLGGLLFFGPIGFIMGPVFLAFFFALLDIYPVVIKNTES